MHYDLALISELCAEPGLNCAARDVNEVVIHLEVGLELIFRNVTNEDDCLIGFDGTQWHTHDDMSFYDRHGFHTDLCYLDSPEALLNLADNLFALTPTPPIA
jgi:hypothetical protein